MATVAGVLAYRSDMAANYFGAITAWSVCFLVTIAVSLGGRARPRDELQGLVYSVTSPELIVGAPPPTAGGLRAPGMVGSRGPVVLAFVVLVACTALNLWFW